MPKGKQPSLMEHNFATVPNVSTQRSTFDRSHGCKTTFDSGYLIPVYVDEVVPGDTLNLRMQSFARLATPLHPFMDNMYLDSHFFAVPVRLLWDNWEKFNGAQDNPGDSTDFLIPTITSPAGGHLEGSLSDYFGIPTQVATLEHSALWHRGYNLIYNTWFKDENLQNNVTINTGNGPDAPTDYTLLKRGKRHDYFTSCLPWPQKGDAVSLPLGTSAPVTGFGLDNQVYGSASKNIYETDATGTTVYAQSTNVGSVTTAFLEEDPNNSGFPNLRADLTNAAAATINDLRENLTVQLVYETDARGGTRYVEMIKAHFGVTSPDARMQRPEYLGGGSSPVNVSPVTQTSQTATTPQGNLAGFGTSSMINHGFTKSFTEHCIIIGLVSARADLSYQQGLNRMWSRSTRFDFYLPSLANLGEQSVLNKELYADASANDDLVFGYQERWAEMRYKNSIITGAFRSNAATPLDTWHLAQDFATLPVLNDTFIKETPPVDRVLAVPSEPDFLFDSYFNIKHSRPMPTFSVPSKMGIF